MGGIVGDIDAVRPIGVYDPDLAKRTPLTTCNRAPRHRERKFRCIGRPPVVQVLAPIPADVDTVVP